MKRITLGVALLIALVVSSCQVDKEQQVVDYIRGSLLYTFKCDSIREPWGNIIVSKGTKLENLRFRFKPSGDAWRYDGKDPYFPGLTWQQFRFHHIAGTYGSYDFGGNTAVVNGAKGKLMIYQYDVPRIFFCTAVPDGDGMDGHGD